MKNVIYKILFKIFNKINKFKIIVSIKYYELETNQKINYVTQGEGGLVLSGDITKFRIAETSHLKSGSYIECSGGVLIGEYFHTGRGLMIFSVAHDYLKAEALPYDEKVLFSPVIIGDFVWCGANVSILPGVIIGQGAIIGMNSVVTKDVPENAIVVGNPAQVIKYRDKEKVESLIKDKKFN